MTKESIQEYTRRISEANKSEIIVCVFEIGEIYMEDAIECYREQDMDGFKVNCNKASRCIDDLLEALDFSYELAFPLMRIYTFLNKELSLASIKYDIKMVKKVQELFTKVKLSFEEVAKQDKSQPVMQNAQSVYAGLTYGKNSLNESITGDTNRGFKV